MNRDLDPATDAAAREIFGYLSECDPRPNTMADAVLGFGMFDLTLAMYCGDLYAQQRARRIIFTGGVGAGTADLGEPEADAWSAALFRAYPTLPPADVIVENRSTNTKENIAFTAALLARDLPELAFGRGIRTALIVSSPSRLRRVKLTMQLLQPHVRVTRQLPRTDFDHERALYESKHLDFIEHLAGELDRIIAYPARGWTVTETLPPAIANAHATLRQR